MILLDANILVRMCNSQDPDYQRTMRVVFDFRKVDTLAITPQTLYEFWAVATRDRSVNGLAMDNVRTSRWMARYARFFHFLAEPADLFHKWSALVSEKNIHGFRAHDARYVALMECLGIQKLMTYNVKHYSNLPVTLIDPKNH